MKTYTNPWLIEGREQFYLALPLVAALLAEVGMETVDTLMMGRLGARALAAGALSGAIFAALLVASMGLLTAVGVLVARARGAKQARDISTIVWQGIYTALLMSVPCMLACYYSEHLLLALHQDPAVIKFTGEFLRAITWGFPGALCFFALREFVSALGKPRIIMLITVSAIPLNAVANYILMYGKLGCPALGISGIGYASSLIEWLMFLSLLAFILTQVRFKVYLLAGHGQRINLAVFKQVWKIGWPVAVMLGFEVGLFSITTALMGYFGESALAAHQVALQCSIIVFMIPLGISQATGIRVGFNLGSNQPQQAKRAVTIGLVYGLIVALTAAVIFLSMPYFIISLFLDTNKAAPHILQLGVSFLIIVAIYQFGDVVQVISSGALRGHKDTFVPMLLGLVSYWLVGLSSGYWLAFHTTLGSIGLWWGLAIGIAISGLLLYLRLRRQITKSLTIGVV